MLRLAVEEFMLTFNVILTITPKSVFNVICDDLSKILCSFLSELCWRLIQGCSWNSCSELEGGCGGRELGQDALGFASVSLLRCPRMEIPQPLGPCSGTYLCSLNIINAFFTIGTTCCWFSKFPHGLRLLLENWEQLWTWREPLGNSWWWIKTKEIYS